MTSQLRKWFLQQKTLKNRKATGKHNMPAEFWKTICVQDSLSCQWAVCLCNKVWCSGHVPDDWHEAVVSAIFKKGDPASCENYRPISLLAIGYKLFATILLRRLKATGADARIWPTQFGFRTGRSCADALFVARRLLERTRAAKDGSLVFLALDWAKAFDSISPDGLIVALLRFGILDGFCAIIRAIYSGRRFVVRDAGHTSEPRPQHFGISQGCPLSPFLFSIVMTVLLFDASAKFAMAVETRQPCVLPVNELVYADDTLVVATDPCRAETHMRCIEAMGMNYGLRLNWKKCEVLPIGCEASIAAPDGSYLTCKSSISYLGSYLDATGAVSFRSLASVTHGHGTQALYWRCAKQKDCAKIFRCFKSENKASSRSAPPTTAVASLYTLDPQEFFGRPRRCGCSAIRGRRVWPKGLPLALVAPKSAGEWVKPKVNSRNWRESGGILPCTPHKRSVSSKLVSCQSCCIACTQCRWIRRNYGKLMGFKQSASVLSFVSHLRTSVVFQMQRCCREATANACPPSWNSDSYVYFNPLQCYLMMMFADDAFSNLVALFCKTCQLHAAGVTPNKYGFPKCREWQWKLLKVLTC